MTVDINYNSHLRHKAFGAVPGRKMGDTYFFGIPGQEGRCEGTGEYTTPVFAVKGGALSLIVSQIS